MTCATLCLPEAKSVHVNSDYKSADTLVTLFTCLSVCMFAEVFKLDNCGCNVLLPSISGCFVAGVISKKMAVETRIIKAKD